MRSLLSELRAEGLSIALVDLDRDGVPDGVVMDLDRVIADGFFEEVIDNDSARRACLGSGDHLLPLTSDRWRRSQRLAGIKDQASANSSGPRGIPLVVIAKQVERRLGIADVATVTEKGRVALIGDPVEATATFKRSLGSPHDGEDL